MDNENKELQNGMTEAELEEKVMEDVSEKIRDAAAELEDEIAEAEETAAEDATEEDADAEVDADAEAEEVVEVVQELIGYDEDGNPIYAEVPVVEEAEPQMVTMPLMKWLLSLAGGVIAGALILLLAFQIPGWMANGGSSAVPATPLFQGGAVVKVAGENITQEDMEYYIYKAATEYLSANGGVSANADPAQFDWSTEAEDGRTAEDVVKENAQNMAIENMILMKQGKKAGIKLDRDQEKNLVDAQEYQLTKQYGEELVEANALAQGYASMAQYKRFMMRNSYGVAIADDMQENPGNYYPDDETLNEFKAEDGATVKHILVMLPQEEAPAEGEAAPAEGEAAPAEGEAAPAETAADKKALAEDILKKAQAGEDFDALIQEFNEDPGQPPEGYTFKSGKMAPEFEEAAFALGINEISGIVETQHGYHIIKRLPGEIDLFNYWKSDMKIKVKEAKMADISVADICARVAESQAKFEELYAAYQEEHPTQGMSAATAGGAY